MRFSILVLFIFSFIISHSQTQKKVDNSFKDSSTYSILSLKAVENSIRFKSDTKYRNSDLSQKELKQVERLFLRAINNYNQLEIKNINSNTSNKKSRIKQIEEFSIPLTKRLYRKQLIPFIDEKGSKMVYINCFVSDPEYKEFHEWSDLVEVYDGGNDYFQVLINLSKGKIEFIRINSYG